MGLNSVITTLGTTYTVTRKADGSYTDGDWTPGAGADFEITASVQPLTGRDLHVLPEGQHVSGVKKIFTATELRTRNDNAGADRVDIEGEDWEVYMVEHWTTFDGEEHYVAFASRIANP